MMSSHLDVRFLCTVSVDWFILEHYGDGMIRLLAIVAICQFSLICSCIICFIMFYAPTYFGNCLGAIGERKDISWKSKVTSYGPRLHLPSQRSDSVANSLFFLFFREITSTAALRQYPGSAIAAEITALFQVRVFAFVFQ